MPTPSWFFYWISVCTQIHSLPTHAQHYLSLHLNNNVATDFIPVWDHTYSPTIIYYIIRTRNIPYFSASDMTLFLSFMNTNNISGYIMTPVITEAFYNHHFSACPITTVLRHTLQHLLYFTHPPPTYAKKSFRNSLPQNDIHPSVRSNVHIMS